MFATPRSLVPSGLFFRSRTVGKCRQYPESPCTLLGLRPISSETQEPVSPRSNVLAVRTPYGYRLPTPPPWSQKDEATPRRFPWYGKPTPVFLDVYTTPRIQQHRLERYQNRATSSAGSILEKSKKRKMVSLSIAMDPLTPKSAIEFGASNFDSNNNTPLPNSYALRELTCL